MKRETLVEYWGKIRPQLTLGRLAIAAFLVVIVFADEHSMIQRQIYGAEARQLQQEVNHYNALIEEKKQLLLQLESDPDMVETIAREHYRMKRANEDVYIIND